MCLIIFAWDAHPEYKLVMVANRDEEYKRPTARASYWEDAPDILAGRDLESGGTWLGINRKTGKFAAVTNYREAFVERKDASSRGYLPLNYIMGSKGPAGYMRSLEDSRTDYNGYNLLAGTPDGLYHYSNKGDKVKALSPGIYGLSNKLLNTEWPKVERGKKKLEDVIFYDDWSHGTLIKMMYDCHRPSDDELPKTGVSFKLEKALAPMFIKTDKYGTCSTSVLTITHDGYVRFSERHYNPLLGDGIDEKFEFQLEDYKSQS
ncbi:NRDE family protein [Flammeovirgaceae bacterium SG7u.111]|nr:NRDE family protein [Flammeovirgaceae bacterium SG7u.132]WPO33263.1 NRDE family protein [Flammeovirgaceae bacterium SG7u.111]